MGQQGSPTLRHPSRGAHLPPHPRGGATPEQVSIHSRSGLFPRNQISVRTCQPEGTRAEHPTAEMQPIVRHADRQRLPTDAAVTPLCPETRQRRRSVVPRAKQGPLAAATPRSPGRQPVTIAQGLWSVVPFFPARDRLNCSGGGRETSAGPAYKEDSMLGPHLSKIAHSEPTVAMLPIRNR